MEIVSAALAISLAAGGCAPAKTSSAEDPISVMHFFVREGKISAAYGAGIYSTVIVFRYFTARLLFGSPNTMSFAP